MSELQIQKIVTLLEFNSILLAIIIGCVVAIVIIEFIKEKKP